MAIRCAFLDAFWREASVGWFSEPFGGHERPDVVSACLAGFAKLRSQLTSRELRSGALAQVYGNLRRMNLHADADLLWPRVQQEVKGRMAREDVLQIWATCPPTKLLELDKLTAKVLTTAKQLEPWQLLSASRPQVGL